MKDKETQGIALLSVGGLVFIVSIIASALFAEKIAYGEYIFTIIIFSALTSMFVGMRKTMQNIASKRAD